MIAILLESKRFYLSRLKSQYLRNIFANIKLGEEHVISLLTHHQYEKILRFGSLKQKQKDAISSAINEKTGSTATVINTILTGMVGAWLGLYDYIEINIDPLLQLVFVLLAAFIISVIIGYLNYRSSTDESKKSIREQKLKNLQLRLAIIILNKRKKLMKKIIYMSNKMLRELYKKREVRKKEWLLLRYNIKKETDLNKIKLWLIQFIDKKLKNTKYLNKKYINDINKYFLLNLKISYENMSKQQKNHCPDYLKALTNNELKPHKFSLDIRHWILGNLKKIFIIFFPTLFGVFGSTFVYLGGVPNILDKIEFGNLGYIFDHPITKISGLTLSVVITVYLAYFAVKNIYRSYMRDKAFVISDQKIAEVELKYVVINKIFSSVNHLFFELKKIILLFKILEIYENIDQNQSQ